MSHCSFLEDCLCRSCQHIAFVAESVLCDDDLRARFAHRVEELLQSKFESTRKAGLMCDLLERDIKTALQELRQSKKAPASHTNRGRVATERMFYKDERGCYWMSMPRSNGWLIASIHSNGYRDKKFYRDFRAFSLQIDQAKLVRTADQKPLVLVDSPKFKVLNAIGEAYQEWKNGRIDKVRYDDLVAGLLADYRSNPQSKAAF